MFKYNNNDVLILSQLAEDLLFGILIIAYVVVVISIPNDPAKQAGL
jgi:hypothetical protein